MASYDTAPLTTGVPGLDTVLGGGILPGSIVMLVGVPGSGKTILAQQIAHHRVSQGERVLFLIGYSETQDKLIANGQRFDFFAPERVGSEILFGNLIDLLRQGSEETEDAIVAMARQQRAKLVVLDGFSSIRHSLPDEPAPGAFLYSLGNKLALLGATTIVTTEGDLSRNEYEPEYTISDAIIGLGRTTAGLRDRRLLDVNKVRGASPIIGRHFFTIDTSGINVYPRLETVVGRRQMAWNNRPVTFGIEPLDRLVNDGLTLGTSTLAAGSPGTGKTLLSLHFIAEGARRNEPSMMVEFIEDRAQIDERARIFGLDDVIHEGNDLVIFQEVPAYEMEADLIVHRIIEQVERRGIQRLVIDSATELQRAIDGPRRADFFAALVHALRTRNVTSLITFDVPTIVGSELSFADSPLVALAENLILLRQAEYQGSLYRMLSVLKLRFGMTDQRFHSYVIRAPEGIVVAGPVPTAEGWMTGVARSVVDSIRGN
jgi:circadian clock protein KaiC